MLFVGQGGGILRYFKIIYTDIPQIVFAHKYETESHEIHLGIVPGRAEITFAENGTLYFSNNKSIPEGTLGINTYDESVFVTSRGAPHRHTTICIDGGKTECVPPEKLLYDLLSKPDTQSLFFVMAETVSTPKTCEKAKKLSKTSLPLKSANHQKAQCSHSCLRSFRSSPTMPVPRLCPKAAAARTADLCTAVGQRST